MKKSHVDPAASKTKDVKIDSKKEKAANALFAGIKSPSKDSDSSSDSDEKPKEEEKPVEQVQDLLSLGTDPTPSTQTSQPPVSNNLLDLLDSTPAYTNDSAASSLVPPYEAMSIQTAQFGAMWGTFTSEKQATLQ